MNFHEQRAFLLGTVLTMAFTSPMNCHAESLANPGDTTSTIEQLLVEKMSREGIPGLSIAIVENGEMTWSRGYGMADVENSVPATPETAYRTASIGKPMTATAVL